MATLSPRDRASGAGAPAFLCCDDGARARHGGDTVRDGGMSCTSSGCADCRRRRTGVVAVGRTDRRCASCVGASRRPASPHQRSEVGERVPRRRPHFARYTFGHGACGAQRPVDARAFDAGARKRVGTRAWPRADPRRNAKSASRRVRRGECRGGHVAAVCRFGERLDGCAVAVGGTAYHGVRFAGVTAQSAPHTASAYR